MSIYEKIDSLIQRVEEYLEKSEPEAVDEGEKTIQIFTINEPFAKAIDKYSTWGTKPKSDQSTPAQMEEWKNKNSQGSKPKTANTEKPKSIKGDISRIKGVSDEMVDDKIKTKHVAHEENQRQRAALPEGQGKPQDAKPLGYESGDKKYKAPGTKDAKVIRRPKKD